MILGATYYLILQNSHACLSVSLFVCLSVRNRLTNHVHYSNETFTGLLKGFRVMSATEFHSFQGTFRAKPSLNSRINSFHHTYLNNHMSLIHMRIITQKCQSEVCAMEAEVYDGYSVAPQSAHQRVFSYVYHRFKSEFAFWFSGNVKCFRFANIYSVHDA